MSRKRADQNVLYAVLVLALAGCVGAGAQSKIHSQVHPVSPESQVIAAETALQRDEITGNLSGLKSVLSPDFVQADKIMLNRDQVLNLVERAHSVPCHFGMPTIDHPVVTFLEPDIATIAYQSVSTLTCGGHVAQAQGNVSCVWVNVKGRWQARLRSEIVVAAEEK
jgi:hypothetical protein